MFGIRIDNEWVDLPLNMGVKLSRFNSLFDFETVRGSLVNDFGVPFTPKNDRIFGWFRDAKMRLPNKKYYCEKISDGYIIERGFIDLVDCTENEYILAFTQNLSEVFGVHQNTPLPLFDLGGETSILPVKEADYLTDKVCYPSINNAMFYGTNVQNGYNGQMNDWRVNDALNVNARVPMVFVRFFFERIGQICNFKFYGSFFESDLFKRLVFVNTRSLDDEMSINFANHLPEMTLPELVKELRIMFNLGVYFDVNKRIMYAHFGNELLEKPTKLNWTGKVTYTNARKPERVNRLQLDWDLESDDNITKRLPLPSIFDKYVSEESQIGSVFELRTKISTFAEIDELASIEQIGVTKRFNQTGAKFGCRLGIWAGINNDGIPIITNDIWEYKLTWNGENGLAKKCYSNYEKMRAKTSYKSLIARLNAVDLHQIDWHNNPNAEHSVFIAGKEYYIAKVEVMLPLNGECLLDLIEKP